MTKKLEYEYVKQYFEEQECVLLATEYVNNSTPMDYICECKRRSKITWHNFSGGHRCSDCGDKSKAEALKLDYEYIKDYFREQGCTLLETTYANTDTPMSYVCVCKRTSKITWHNFRIGQRCFQCGIERTHGKQRLDYEYVNNYFKEQGCELLETKYCNNETPMAYICACKNESKITWNSFQQGHRCMDCGNKKAAESNRLERHPRWNPDRQYVAMMKCIKTKLYTSLRTVLNSTGQKKTSHSRDILGYTPQDLRIHIKSHPNWSRVKGVDWHLDHIFPISAFVEHGITDIKIINALDNLQPLTPFENISKGNRYSKEEFYSYLSGKRV
jgi:hypothetical protein